MPTSRPVTDFVLDIAPMGSAYFGPYHSSAMAPLRTITHASARPRTVREVLANDGRIDTEGRRGRDLPVSLAVATVLGQGNRHFTGGNRRRRSVPGTCGIHLASRPVAIRQYAALGIERRGLLANLIESAEARECVHEDGPRLALLRRFSIRAQHGLCGGCGLAPPALPVERGDRVVRLRLDEGRPGDETADDDGDQAVDGNSLAGVT